VLAAVHHADLVAHRVGEPFGTFLLAVAVTFSSWNSLSR
jgi:Ca2+:H+ antiporter